MSNFVINWNSKGWYVSDNEVVILKTCDDYNVMRMVQDESIPFDMVAVVHEPETIEFIYKNVNWEISDIVRELDNGVYQIERRWKNIGLEDQKVVLLFEAIACYEPSFYMIPCVNYNGNKWGIGKEPKGLIKNGKPWEYSYNRVGIPSATFSENEKYSIGLFASNYDRNSLKSACSLEAGAKKMIHKIICPENEGPIVYIGKDLYGPSAKKSINISSNCEFSAKFYIVVSKVENKNMGWTRAYDIAVDLYINDTFFSMDDKRVWELGTEFVKENLLNSASKCTAFEMGLLPDGRPIKGKESLTWEHREHVRYEIGWCGQNATLANALIYDYLLFDDKDSFNKGVAVMDFWEKTARLENGLFYTLLDDVIHGKEGQLMDTCNLGWGAWQMMTGYELAQNAGLNRPQWFDMGIRLCDFFCKKSWQMVLLGDYGIRKVYA